MIFCFYSPGNVSFARSFLGLLEFDLIIRYVISSYNYDLIKLYFNPELMVKRFHSFISSLVASCWLQVRQQYVLPRYRRHTIMDAKKLSTRKALGCPIKTYQKHLGACLLSCLRANSHTSNSHRAISHTVNGHTVNGHTASSHTVNSHMAIT